MLALHDLSMTTHSTAAPDASPALRLGPLLRWAEETSATVWVETSAPCEVEVCGATSRTFQISGHHYAVVVVDGLAPATTTPYEVRLDGRVVWPEPGDDRPRSVIRTAGGSLPVTILAGSCRAAAPHEPPYTQDLAFNPEGRGVDTLWAHGHRMRHQPPERWPTLLVFAGDQIYADDSSPEARRRIEARRHDDDELDSTHVRGYDEYCWLYHEAWSLPTERWLLANVPSAMIFDDHDMVDDWNISAAWIEDMSHDETWSERAINGYMSYWVYQHLGNLSPRELTDLPLLDEIRSVPDGTEILRDWARRCLATSGTADGEHFSHARRIGDVTVVTVDCRSGRVLDEGRRAMVQPSEWERIVEWASQPARHLVLVTSLPVYLPDGIHDLHTWNACVCAGAWGARARGFGERVRRSLDLEDWPAFPVSFAAFGALVSSLRSGATQLASIVVVSGDIHFSYAARVAAAGDGSTAPVWQIVSSPIRNALIPHERSAMRLATTRTGARVAGALRRLARGGDTRPRIQLAAGPYFANNMCQLRFTADGASVVFEQSTSSATGDEPDLRIVDRLTL